MNDAADLVEKRSPRVLFAAMSGRISSSKLLELDARRICLIKPSALGDVVQTLPLLPVLRERFRNASIAWVINRDLAELLEDHPDLDTLIPFDRRGSWADWMRLLGDLRSRRFDLVFDLQGLLRTGVMTLATGAAVRVGLESAREGAHWACQHTIPDTSRLVPAHLRYWRVAEAIGMADRRAETHVALSEQHKHWARMQLKKLPGPVLAINPGARWVTKRFPARKLAVVASKAMRRYGFSTVILGGQGDLPVAIQLEYWLRRLAPSSTVLNLAGRTSLKQLAAVLTESACLLTNDSGPMHLAAGLGIPVVGLFTCTSSLRSGPPGKQHELVSTNVPCAASYKKTCPYSGSAHLACLEELETERVWQAVIRLVEKNRIGRRAA